MAENNHSKVKLIILKVVIFALLLIPTAFLLSLILGVIFGTPGGLMLGLLPNIPLLRIVAYTLAIFYSLKYLNRLVNRILSGLVQRANKKGLSERG